MVRSFALAVATLTLLSACGPAEPEVAGGPPVMRRLTEDQYRSTISDVFGPDIVVAGRFDPVTRTDGLIALGASVAAINASSYELYDNIARGVAAQVIDQTHRDWLVSCQPAAITAPDDACAAEFFKRTGRLLYRRALTDQELKLQVDIAKLATMELGDFYKGIEASLSAMLVAPEFLYVTDTMESDPARPNGVRLTPYAKASRLSFFLWNTTPDDALLTAAENGELNDSKGLAKQVERMIAAPHLALGVRAFFNDMLAFDGFETLQKDTVIYPMFGLATVKDSHEQALRTIVDQTITTQGDYRDLFTTRKTFVSAPLGLVYRVPVADPEGWVPYEFPEGGRYVGVQSFAGFLALHSHPGRSSATLRGKAVREILMCQKVPDPPANVDFTLVSDSTNPVHKTARERLTAHNTEPTCAGCHKLMDPIGLALENFDGGAQWRTTENGAVIDTTGDLDGVAYNDAVGLGKALATSPSVPACLVRRLANYAVGRQADRAWHTYLDQRFESDKYRLPALLRHIALSDAFYAVTPTDAAVPTRSASAGVEKKG